MPPIPRRTLADVLYNAGWKRSRKGNLYKRLLDETTFTIFKRDDGSYGCCIYTEEYGTDYMDDSWETEREARKAAIEWMKER